MATPIIHQFDQLRKRLEELTNDKPNKGNNRKTIPRAFDLHRAKLALDHPENYISGAFLWSSSEEGSDYWCDVARDGHTEESLQLLQDYIDSYTNQEGDTS